MTEGDRLRQLEDQVGILKGKVTLLAWLGAIMSGLLAVGGTVDLLR